MSTKFDILEFDKAIPKTQKSGQNEKRVYDVCVRSEAQKFTN